MKFLAAVLIALLSVSQSTFAAEQKELSKVNISELTKETQKYDSDPKSGMHLVWWIPSEFWEASFSANKALTEDQLEEFRNILQPYAMLAVVQADISVVGSFAFYDREKILSNLQIQHTDSNGKVRKIKPLKKIPADLKLLQQQIRPVLAAAMGNMGQSLEFLTVKDVVKGNRILSPYEAGELTIRLVTNSGKNLDLRLDTLLNSLHEPRKCPNGKDAHVSWQYCPWDGSKIEQPG